MSKSYKYLPYDLLKKLNKKAVRFEKNRFLTDDILNNLDRSKVYPVLVNILHNDFEQRCEILLNEKGSTAFLDMDCEDFQTLPRQSLPSVAQ
jgi:hypothetical protein